MTELSIPESLGEDLREACERTLGDRLRSVTYFTRDGWSQVYRRDDLAADADLDSFAANERLGFTSRHTYAGTELGDYRYTIRVFDSGYLVRVIEGDEAVFVTTDRVETETFDEVAECVEDVLERY